MDGLRGGDNCFCSWYWQGNGGSSIADNTTANHQSGYHSEHGCNEWFYSNGYVLCGCADYDCSCSEAY